MPRPLISLSLRSRLYLGCGLLILLLLAPAYYSLRQLAELRDIAFDLRTSHTAASLNVGRVAATLSELNRLQRNFVAAPTDETRADMYERLDLARLYVSRLGASGYQENARAEELRLDTLAAATARIDRARRLRFERRRSANARPARPRSRPAWRVGWPCCSPS
jgi:hypothetical protein